VMDSVSALAGDSRIGSFIAGGRRLSDLSPLGQTV